MLIACTFDSARAVGSGVIVRRNAMSSQANNRSVLIAGASLAGPSLAYWLTQYGFKVTVVERAKTWRDGGHSVDLRGTTVDVAKKMGILDFVKQCDVQIDKLTVVDEAGETVGSLNIGMMVGDEEGRDIELPRGELVKELINLTGNKAEWIYNDYITAIDDRADGAHVTFNSGAQRTFDLVIGADGSSSRTRRLVFGDSDEGKKYTGYAFALFAMPNYLGLTKENLSWNIGGKMAVMLPTEDPGMVHGMFAVLTDEPPKDIFGENAKAMEFFTKAFEGYGWQVPKMIELLHSSDDVYFDTANYIDLPHWSKGRVGLVGDAGYCPSLFTGQGATVSMIGAYILGGELAKHADHETAFAEYERIYRPFITATQASVPGMIFQLAPRTDEDVAKRNAVFRNPELLAGKERPAPPTVDLPDYSSLVVN
jgi:2-polyprenyl-6-methoxyphenol hydroxylase-like FAD-dependent oxidoreductase